MSDILIVDDARTDRELLSRVVVGLGHRAILAVDGEEALAKARSLKPALVLLDVVMPRLDGFNVCRQLKRDPATSALPVVLITAKSAESDRFWGRKQGADDHIAKPFTPDQIKAVIRRFISPTP